MKAGEVVAERFVIAGLAGSGAMGQVYKAYDRELSQDVALKLMAANAPGDRFQREAEVLSGLHHPNIVRYVAHGFTGDELYLAMDWLEGEDLARRLARGSLSAAETLDVAAQAAAALGAAHAQGVVHRDVKPSNLVLLNGSLSEMRLVDFGLAAVRYSPKKGPLTQVGLILGTPAYMAPEQVRCEREIDARADVYSLGCVLFECLTGRCPFEGNTPLATFAKILVEDAPRASELVRGIPEVLDDLIARMLKKTREERPGNGTALADIISRATLLGKGGLMPVKPPSLTRHEQRLVSVVLLGNVVSRTIPRAPDSTPSSIHSIQNDATAPLEIARAPTLLDIPMPASLAELSKAPLSRDALDPVLAALRAIAGRFGGDVEPLPDGSVVIVHGVREGTADQVSRAARSALALRAAFPSAPMALSTGRSTTAEARTIGEALDRASELVSRSAVEGGILIDDVSQGLLEARFEVETVNRSVRLTAERQAAKAERTLLGRSTPCVGRESELGTLMELLLATVASRKSRAVVVSAAAGVGKSRLRYEFLRRLAATLHDVSIWVGWADPMGAGSPFGIAGPLIRRVLGIVDHDSPEERRNKVVSRVMRIVQPAEAQRVAEFLGELVGAHFPDVDRLQLRAARADTVLLGDQVRRAWGDFVAAEAARRPIVIILEDIHWGDWASLRLIDTAMTSAAELPLFVLALGRPELHARFPALWGDRSVTQMALHELDAMASAAIVANALGRREDDLADQIVARAAGNAFYLEELIRAVADGRGISLPQTVLAVAQARLEGLEGAERQILRAASVFGASFSRDGVRELCGADIVGELSERLRSLLEREIIVVSVDRDASAASEPQYAFRHAILREAAYAMLTQEDCVLGHRLAGAWLARRPDNDPIIVAEHLEQGGALSEAGIWYGKAAKLALEGSDFARVQDRVARALRCGLVGVEAGRVHLLSAEAHRWANENANAAEHGCAAMGLLPAGSPEWFDAAGEAALALGRVGRFDELGAIAQKLQASAELAPTPSVVAALARVSDQLLFAGQYQLYQSLVDTFTALTSHSAADPVIQTWVTYVRAGTAMMNDASLYVIEMRKLVTGFESLGDVRNTCLQRVNLADAYIHVGDYTEAASLSRQTLVEGTHLKLQITAAYAKCNLARALGELGELGEARKLAQEAASEMRLAHDHRMEASSQGLLARLLLRSGELVSAERAVRGALSLAQAPLPIRAVNLARLAEILLVTGQLPEARTCALEAFDILTSLGTIDDGEGYVRLVYAQALLATGETDAGRKSLADARSRLLSQAKTMSSTHWRSLFLSKVPEHAKTLAMAETWCGPVTNIVTNG